MDSLESKFCYQDFIYNKQYMLQADYLLEIFKRLGISLLICQRRVACCSMQVKCGCENPVPLRRGEADGCDLCLISDEGGVAAHGHGQRQAERQAQAQRD